MAEAERLPASSWAESVATVIAAWTVDPSHGLSEQEARRRALVHGPNELHRREPMSAWMLLLKQFKSLIVGILAVATVLALAFGEMLESLAILVVIILNTAIGFFTELRAVRSMEALYALGTVSTRVRREGKVVVVPAEKLVPGDVVVLEAGDVVTADLRVIECSKLQADESALTGESLPVRKQSEALPSKTPLAERSNMLYKGTSVTRGSGIGIAVETGMKTELGSISDLVATAEKSTTPLEQRLDRLGRKLIWLTLAVGVLVIGGGVASGQQPMLMIQTGLALAVAAIPEGLPVVATIALARGLHLMARRNALINRLASVETLGATRVICVDKTGTLTENTMTVTRIVLPAGDAGPAESWLAGDAGAGKSDSAGLLAALENAVLCNNAQLGEPAGHLPADPSEGVNDGTRQAQGAGDPLELALLEAARLAGIESVQLAMTFPRVREIAFDPETRLMATFHESPDGIRVAVKGAPEAVLECCTSEWVDGESRPLDQARRQYWDEANESLAGSGLRILAVAGKNVQSEDDPAYENLTFLALVGLFDPPRQDVRDAISQCHGAGIDIVMITGDQPDTALEVARAVGIVSGDDDEVIRGSDIRPAHLLSASERQRFLAAHIFARVSPAQKLHLIELHQGRGNTIAMTGDGVNDAPALQKADIGIAMGQRGTQVAREAADMVLQDDRFSTIVAAVHQGRVIFANIRAFVLYLISCNVSEVMVVGLAVFFSTQLPILPLQILFLNLVTDVFPALALGFSPAENGVMKRPPRPAREAILSTRHWLQIAIYGLVFTVAVLGALYLAQQQLGASPGEAITISFLTLAFAQLWHVFNMREERSHPLVNSITRNRWVWAALALCIMLLLVAVYVRPIASVLDVHAPNIQGWALILVMSLIPLVFGYVMKRAKAALAAGRPGSKQNIARLAA